jgi:hypothetical protein
MVTWENSEYPYNTYPAHSDQGDQCRRHRDTETPQISRLNLIAHAEDKAEHEISHTDHSGVDYLRTAVKQAQETSSEVGKKSDRQPGGYDIFNKTCEQSFFTAVILFCSVILTDKGRTGLSKRIKDQKDYYFYIKSRTGARHHC